MYSILHEEVAIFGIAGLEVHRVLPPYSQCRDVCNVFYGVTAHHRDLAHP